MQFFQNNDNAVLVTKLLVNFDITGPADLRNWLWFDYNLWADPDDVFTFDEKLALAKWECDEDEDDTSDDPFSSDTRLSFDSL